MKAIEEASTKNSQSVENEEESTAMTLGAAALSQGKKLKAKVVHFGKITVYYFRRKQSFCTIPAKGGTTLGMARRHSSVEQYVLYDSRQGPPLDSTQGGLQEKTVTSVKPVSEKSRKAYLKEAGVLWIKEKEAEECKKIRLSRSSCGCKCRGQCEPATCICALNGVACQVDSFRRKFPCSCGVEQCKNPEGRRVYEHSEVKSHYVEIFEKMKENNFRRSSTCSLAELPF